MRRKGLAQLWAELSSHQLLLVEVTKLHLTEISKKCNTRAGGLDEGPYRKRKKYRDEAGIIALLCQGSHISTFILAADELSASITQNKWL